MSQNHGPMPQTPLGGGQKQPAGAMPSFPSRRPQRLADITGPSKSMDMGGPTTNQSPGMPLPQGPTGGGMPFGDRQPASPPTSYASAGRSDSGDQKPNLAGNFGDFSKATSGLLGSVMQSGGPSSSSSTIPQPSQSAYSPTAGMSLQQLMQRYGYQPGGGVSQAGWGSYGTAI